MKRVIKYAKRLVIALLTALLAYFIIAVVLSFITTRPDQVNCKNEQVFFIGSNGLHLDLTLPVASLPESFITRLKVPPEVKYLSFGWGDKAFYIQTPTWQELELSVLLGAFFLKSDAAMHVTYQYGELASWNRVSICNRQYSQLESYIVNSFRQNASGGFMKIEGAGYTSRDEFYEATGHYTLLKTCNNWVNIGLKKAGVKTSIWSPFDFGVLYHIEKGDH